MVDDKSDLLYARLPHNNFHGGLCNGKEERQRKYIRACACVRACVVCVFYV